MTGWSPTARRAVAAAFLTAAACLLTPAAAGAADRVFWSNIGTSTLASTNLDGTGGASLVDTRDGVIALPTSVAVDPSTDTVYWTNYAESSIYFAPLEGEGGAAQLDTTGTDISQPWSIEIDPASNSIYWTNAGTNTISRANLDGTGGGSTLNTAGASINFPSGMAIDPATNSLYWVSAGTNTISRANLDGTGSGSDISAGGAPIVGPHDVAIDPASNSIYWTSPSVGVISRANLDGSGNGSTISFGGATVAAPAMLAIDRDTGSLYWTNYAGTKISRASLDGSGNGYDLDTSAAPATNPLGLTIVKAPAAAVASQVTGVPDVGQELACQPATWRPDAPGASLMRTPRETSHHWTRDGELIPGADDLTYTPTASGSYACVATATNMAGTASSPSTPVAVTGTPQFAVSPSTWAFGSVDPDAGASTARTFTVTNGGSGALTVGAVTLEGADMDEFEIIASDCGTDVSPFGGTCAVQVVFDPRSTGAKSASLRFAHGASGSPATVALSGTGAAAPTPPGPGGSGGQPGGPGGQPGGSGGIPGGGGPPAPAASNSLVTVFSTALSVNGRGRMQVMVTCLGGRPCSGAIAIRTAKAVRIGPGKRKRRLKLATARYSTLAGGMGTVRVVLKPKMRKALARLGLARVVITTTTVNPGTRSRISTHRAIVHARNGALPVARRR